MPLYRDIPVGSDARLCIWQTTEREDDLPRPEGLDLSAIGSPSRRLETLAVYQLLAHATGCRDLLIDHDANGRPLVEGWQVGVSHTRGWAALIVSRTRAVAVDIEYMSDRVGRIAPRFIRPDEQADGLPAQLIHWSVKETVYKLLSAEQLQYFEMRLRPFSPLERGQVEVEDLKHPKTIAVAYEVNANFVLTYTPPPPSLP